MIHYAWFVIGAGSALALVGVSEKDYGRVFWAGIGILCGVGMLVST